MEEAIGDRKKAYEITGYFGKGEVNNFIFKWSSPERSFQASEGQVFVRGNKKYALAKKLEKLQYTKDTSIGNVRYAIAEDTASLMTGDNPISSTKVRAFADIGMSRNIGIHPFSSVLDKKLGGPTTIIDIHDTAGNVHTLKLLFSSGLTKPEQDSISQYIKASGI